MKRHLKSKSYIIDTDICIEILRNNQRVISKIKNLPSDIDICTTIINAGELFYGAFHSDNPNQRIKEVMAFLNDITIMPLDLNAVEKYGEIKSRLRKLGQLIPDNDLFIASITIVNNGILVTQNIAHYKRISELKILGSSPKKLGV
ncbi:MAG: type II toxin-antitoxin system VapC family toxin [candidate division WOR-3 bacterium]